MRTLRVFSRHPSHNALRLASIKTPVLSLIRMGSTTKGKLKYQCEINSIDSIKISANKLLMKQKFTEAGVRTAQWWTFKSIDNGVYIFCENFKSNDSFTNIDGLSYPIIAKNIYGSRGTGNYKIDTKNELINWINGRNLSNYIFERFTPYKLEFRFHVDEEGAFYVCRKALKDDIPKGKRWSMNNDSCVWYMDSNDKFLKPNSYKDIVEECIKALKAIKADFLAFDVRVQSNKDNKGNERSYQDFFIVEANSAPSFGSTTTEKYLSQIPIIINRKMGSMK